MCRADEATYPRMAEELRAAGLSVVHHRVGCLMREHDIRVVRTRWCKVTPNSAHSHAIAPNLQQCCHGELLQNPESRTPVAARMDNASGGRAGRHILH